ncbi:MAG TPA: zf-HC2 domain-containing protein [Pyrinomonadaceae bacterium]|nr:zf-HC2 domain-containing protein [Pyrinomonadaceae bacterium]
MRQETNKEMDLLLRRLGRQQDVFAPDAEDHLDADELNAFAENVLPATTRTRYTEHLAECARCRELVVQLTAAAGVITAHQIAKVTEPSGLKKFLASLLSPMVLRYAAPALGLIVVAVIGLVVMRRNAARDQVSQVQPQPAQINALDSTNDSYRTQPQAGLTSESPARGDTSVAKLSDSTPAKPAPVPETTPATREENAPPPKTEVNKVEIRPQSQPVTATDSVKVASADDERKQKNEAEPSKQEADVTVAPKEVAKRDFEAGRADTKKAPATVVARSRPAKPAVGDLSGAQAGAGPGNYQRDGEDKDSSDTRSIAGHYFRKQRGIWTDTTYDGSKETMIVTRNSEGYRALIADEPAIKTIADQLDGQIIVVWKGRIYRIR